jgi:hypothetical protein
MEQLTCTQLVEEKQRDNNGKWIISHRLCGEPATDSTLGQLTNAKAILCEEHLRQAIRQIELSRRGYFIQWLFS